MLETNGLLFPEQNKDRHPFPHTPPQPAFTIQEDFFRTIKIVNETLDRVLKMETKIREEMEKFISEITADNVEYKKLLTDTYNNFATSVTNEVNEFEKTITNAYDSFVASVQNENQEQRKAYLNFKNSVADTLATFERNIETLVNTKVTALVDNGTFSTFIKQAVSDLYGATSVFKGSDTASNIKAKTNSLNGDVYFATDENTNYRYTADGWVNIGSGFSDKEVVDARGADADLKSRLNNTFKYENAFVGIGNGRIYSPTFKNFVFTVPKGSESIKIVYGSGGQNISVLFPDILTQLPNHATLDANGNLNITFNYTKEEVLVFDTVAKVLKMRGFSSVVYTDIVLVENYYGALCGKLCDYVTYDLISKSNKVVNLPFNCHAYSGNNKPLSIVQDNSKAIVTVEQSIMIVVDTTRYEIVNTALKEAFPDNVVLNEKGIAEITIPNLNALVFNLDTRELEIINVSNAKIERSFILFYAYYRNGFGYLLEQRNKQLIENVAEYLPYLPSIVSSNVVTDSEKVEEFATLFNGKKNVEAFAYFTDPHLCQFRGNGWRSEFDRYMATLGAYYKEAPIERVFCGGDWLGHEELPSEAFYRLGLINSTMREYFRNYHIVCGNHDTNYQGCADETAERYTGTIPNETMANLLCNGQAWYTVTGRNTEFYILDTQLENDTIDDYLNEQIEWFGNTLLKSTARNIVLLPHMVWYNTSKTLQPVMRVILDIAKAYNERGTYEGFNFANATGTIRFVMCGHLHVDSVDSLNNIPIISTTHFRDGNRPTFDMCLIDYDNNNVEMVRVGTGENRTVSF